MVVHIGSARSCSFFFRDIPSCVLTKVVCLVVCHADMADVQKNEDRETSSVLEELFSLANT